MKNTTITANRMFFLFLNLCSFIIGLFHYNKLYLNINAADGDSSGFQRASVLRRNDDHVEDRLPSAQTSSSHVSMTSSSALGKTVGTSDMLEESSSLVEKTEKKSSLHASGGLPKIVDHITEEDLSNSCCPLKKLKTIRGNALNFKSDTLENTVLSLEEILNNIKWLKGLLVGVRHPSDERQHSWKFVENRAPSMQR